jgi:predicted transcriptional regulator
VRQRYSENPEEAKRREEKDRNISFSEWWQGKWKELKADLQRYYDSFIICQNPNSEVPVAISSLEKFKERYEQIVESEFATLRANTLSERDDIFFSTSYPVVDSNTFNYEWRDKLFQSITQLLDAIAHKLAIELKDESLHLIQFMTDALWGSSEVKTRLIGSSEEAFVKQLENSLSVLFLRFSRPVADSLIRGPVGSETRERIVRNLGVDIEIIDNYYTGDEEAYKALKRYVKYGSDLLFDPELRHRVLGITESTLLYLDKDTQLASNLDNSLSSEAQQVIQAVATEIEHDINAFNTYLNHAIFSASGFEAYCLQELRRLVDSFRNKEGTWAGVAQNEWVEGNPKLLAELPENLKSQELDLEVCERLRQLSIALKQNSLSQSG